MPAGARPGPRAERGILIDCRRAKMTSELKGEEGPCADPGRVTMILELRDLDERVIQSLFDRICEAAMRAGDETGTAFTFAPLGDAAPPALMNARIREAIAAAAESLGLSRMAFPSGAGHDAQNMARLAPAGMIFVPSRGGISHSPREFTSIEDIAAGADVLLRTLIALDGL
jgi:N-carbamoyl-L-amino-acid hydrolase